jgi:phosphoserine phosphatase
MTKILLTRHGHVEGITPERFRGRQPLALTEQGRVEAEALARRIAGGWKPDRIYTSPMERCIKTGAAVARACGLAAGEARDDLNDIDYGRWQFKTFADAKADDPALFAAWFEAPQRPHSGSMTCAAAGSVTRMCSVFPTGDQCARPAALTLLRSKI